MKMRTVTIALASCTVTFSAYAQNAFYETSIKLGHDRLKIDALDFKAPAVIYESGEYRYKSAMENNEAAEHTSSPLIERASFIKNGVADYSTLDQLNSAKEDHQSEDLSIWHHPLEKQTSLPLLSQMAAEESFQVEENRGVQTLEDVLNAMYWIPLSSMHSFFEWPQSLRFTKQPWLEQVVGSSEGFAIGYKWRDLNLESSAFSIKEYGQKVTEKYPVKWSTLTKKLSFNASPNWEFQLSRGNVSSIDQLIPNNQVRRTSISATYVHPLEQGTWHTTLAWGRNAKNNHEPTVGYLIESAIKLKNASAFFGRLEQVGSDELLRQNESMQRQMLKLNKVVLGYSQSMQVTRKLQFDLGGMVSKHFIPSSIAMTYGKSQFSYMMFMRLKIQ